MSASIPSSGSLYPIHLPVPLVIALRIFGGLGFHFITYPLLVGAFFAGQLAGSRLFVAVVDS